MVHCLLSLALLSQSAMPDLSWSQTRHSVHIAKHQLDYTATAGLLPLTDDEGVVMAQIYFTAYEVQGADPRPITFVWNGGPGSSSLPLQMFCMGPRRLARESSDPKTMYHPVDNEDTLLPSTDLVFIDPVGTGFSKAVKSDARSYWGVEGDIRATAEFIKKYIEITHRENSPVFLAGESYGTFRAAGVSYPLVAAGINLDGIILISSAVHFDAFVNADGNDLPNDLFVPTYAATAAHYKKLKPSWNDHPERAIREAEKFASGDLWTALGAGDNLSAGERHRLAVKLSALTSLPVSYIEKVNLRIDPDDFRTQLLRKEGKRLDKNAADAFEPENVNSKQVISSFSDYVQSELGFKTDSDYQTLNMSANGAWRFGSPLEGFPDESGTLRRALVKKPQLHVFVAQGLYDFQTSFYGAEYTLWHLGLPDELKGNWQMHLYEGGHMMYLNAPARAQLETNLANFLTSCVASRK